MPPISKHGTDHTYGQNVRQYPSPSSPKEKTDRRLPGCGTFAKLANVSISGRMDKNYLVHRFGAARILDHFRV